MIGVAWCASMGAWRVDMGGTLSVSRKARPDVSEDDTMRATVTYRDSVRLAEVRSDVVTVEDIAPLFRDPMLFGVIERGGARGMSIMVPVRDIVSVELCNRFGGAR